MPKIIKQKPQGNGDDNSDDVIARIAPIGFDEDEGLKVLLYGKSGSGKTTLAATFTDDGPMLWIIFSGGKRPGELRSVNTPQYKKLIRQVVVRSTSEVEKLVTHVENTGDYAGVCVDHVSAFQDKVLAEILGIEGDLPEQKSWGLASQQQYGQCTAQCKELLKRTLSLKGHVILLGQERAFNTDETGGEESLLAPFVSVAVTPALAGWIPPQCDYVCQTLIRNKMEDRTTSIGGKSITTQVKSKEVQFLLRTGLHETYAGKFRMPKEKRKELPEFIADPSYEKIKKLIQG